MQKIEHDTKKNHRHRLCLYGDDETFLKDLSVKLRIPITVLLRIALLWYLPVLESGEMTLNEEGVEKYVQITFNVIKKMGTKIIKRMAAFGVNFYPAFPDKMGSNITLFMEDDFW